MGFEGTFVGFGLVLGVSREDSGGRSSSGSRAVRQQAQVSDWAFA